MPSTTMSLPRADGVSFVVPVRNGARWLPRVLPSLLAQDAGVPIEVVMVEDGSGDGSAEILARASAADCAREDRARDGQRCRRGAQRGNPARAVSADRAGRSGRRPRAGMAGGADPAPRRHDGRGRTGLLRDGSRGAAERPRDEPRSRATLRTDRGRRHGPRLHGQHALSRVRACGHRRVRRIAWLRLRQRRELPAEGRGLPPRRSAAMPAAATRGAKACGRIFVSSMDSDTDGSTSSRDTRAASAATPCHRRR